MRLTSSTGFRAAIGSLAAALVVVLATPTPALANNIVVSGTAVQVGESPGTSTVSVRNFDPAKANKVRITVSVSGDAASLVDISIGGGCKGNGGTADCGRMEPMGEKSFTVTVKQKADSGLKQGESKTGNLDLRVEGPHSGTPGTAPITVTGFEQIAKAITGTVTDIDKNKPVEGAEFTADDGKGTKFGPVKTNDKGQFSVNAEIQPGTTINWTVKKKGFETAKDEYEVVQGQAINIEPRLETKEAKESAKPEEDEGTEEKPAEESGFTFVTWVLIILGILLAIGGVFAIWMLLKKGKDDDEDEDANLPNEPPTHQFSASQTGKFGVYEASGTRPGTDNPTMMYNGPLVNDGDLARYGAEPPSAAGFGPAYGEAAPTRAVPSAADAAAATQRYGAAEPPSGSWRSDEPASGSWRGNEPTSGSTQRYPAAEPASGSWRGNEPTSGSWRSDEPASGAPQGYGSSAPASGAPQGYGSPAPASGAPQRYGSPEPASGSWRGNEPTSGSWRSNEPTSGSWQSNEPASGSTQRYPAAEPGGGQYPSNDGYGDRNAHYEDHGSGGRHYRESDTSGGYGDQQPRQSSGRRYRDDDYGDYDDRPRSW